MKPKEKADELVSKYNQLDLKMNSEIYIAFSIQCAIIAVEEIIKESNLYDQTMGYNGVEFWEEVLIELKSM